MYLRLLFTLAASAMLFSCTNKEMRTVREMKIDDVDPSTLQSGVYRGGFMYGGFTYAVRVLVDSGHIGRIDIIKNRTTPYAKKAESVIYRIVEKQHVNVDAVAGATTTSKAFMKAVENALKAPPVGSLESAKNKTRRAEETPSDTVVPQH